jgi:Flp pilus assembly protein TadG
MRNRNKERGSQTLEFTLIGLPLIFLLFSIIHMCFAMMTFHTMQEAVEQGARFVATRGSTCASGSNTCNVTVQQIADVVATSSPGIAASNLKLTLTTNSGTSVVCDKINTCTSSCSSGCSGNKGNKWPDPTTTDSNPGKDIIISADVTSLPSPMYMFWTMYNSAPKIGSTSFHAYSRQRLMF